MATTSMLQGFAMVTALTLSASASARPLLPPARTPLAEVSTGTIKAAYDHGRKQWTPIAAALNGEALMVFREQTELGAGAAEPLLVKLTGEGPVAHNTLGIYLTSEQGVYLSVAEIDPRTHAATRIVARAKAETEAGHLLWK